MGAGGVACISGGGLTNDTFFTVGLGVGIVGGV